MLLSRCQVLEVAGRKHEALKAYRAVLSSNAARHDHRKAAQEAVTQPEDKDE